MTGNGKEGPRMKKKKLKRKKQLIAILFILLFVLIGGTTFKFLDSFRPVAEELPTEEVFGKMILNNPINAGLYDKIGEKKKEEIKIQVNNIREAQRKKKEAEKKEKLIKLEKIKEASEEKKENINKEKIVYLTFDDGPSEIVTPRILDILKKNNINATFFVLGKNANSNGEVLKRIHKEGNAIGHHSYSHEYDHIYHSTENFIGELEKTNKIFKDKLGEEFETRLLRFPGGSFGENKKEFRDEISALGYENYDWNALNGDAEGHGLSKDKLVNKLKETVGSLDDVIVLMHDTDEKVTTADTLPEIIEYLIQQGYVFKTLDEK